MRRIKNFFVYIVFLQASLWILSFLPNIDFSNRVRGWFVGKFCKRCGRNFRLAKGGTINMIRNISIGDDVYIAHDVWMNGVGGLELDDGVIISPGVVISTSKHSYVNGRVQLHKSEAAPVKIGAGSWVASNSVVASGVTIGEGCVIGACSAVSRDLPSYFFCAGTPAKPIKQLR